MVGDTCYLKLPIGTSHRDNSLCFLLDSYVGGKAEMGRGETLASLSLPLSRVCVCVCVAARVCFACVCVRVREN